MDEIVHFGGPSAWIGAEPSGAISMQVKQIKRIYDILSKTYGTFDESDDPWMTNGLSKTPFRSLVSACLSTMTMTTRVVNAAVPLYQRVSSFEELRDLPDTELRRLIKPVAHYNRKTKSLKAMAKQIVEDHGGRIPRSRQDLLQLPGVGPKCADLMLNFLFDEPTIAVDTHIHRLLNRLGIVETDSVEDSAKAINAQTPKRFKRHAHEWLIQHGMQVCVSRRPKCAACVIAEFCRYRDTHH